MPLHSYFSFKVLSCSIVPDFSDACRSAVENSSVFGSLNLIFELTEKNYAIISDF